MPKKIVKGKVVSSPYKKKKMGGAKKMASKNSGRPRSKSKY